ncbi:hypothetical protein JGX37_16075, partial [Listeria monocytogenes]|nr:hypothetical protein [Listeria monocytogenes]MCH5071985.1 hypothetical protein [Listeria monocytogenes]
MKPRSFIRSSIFEARNPKGQAIITEVGGEVVSIEEGRDRQQEITIQGTDDRR